MRLVLGVPGTGTKGPSRMEAHCWDDGDWCSKRTGKSLQLFPSRSSIFLSWGLSTPGIYRFLVNRVQVHRRHRKTFDDLIIATVTA